MSDFPRILYREGTQEECWGVMVDTLTVADADEEAAALVDGWEASPPNPRYGAEEAAEAPAHAPAKPKKGAKS